MTKEKTNLSRKIQNIVVLCLAAIVTYCLFDLFNVPSRIIPVNKINWDSTGIVFSNCIVIGIFLITYYAIDCRNLEKDKNKRQTAELVLKETYDHCIEMVELFEREDAAECAAKHCDFDKLVFQDSVMQQYLNLPFGHNDMICQFAQDGTITAEEYKTYLEIQKNYKSHINIRIMFYDKKGNEDYKKVELFDLINQAKTVLNKIDGNS